MLEKYKVLLWDFDGVIMDSMPIRSKGFEVVLARYPKAQIAELLDFHNLNGGLSRYVKFRYFFENIRRESITEEEVQELASSFSEIMLGLLINEELLISDSVNFIKRNSKNYQMHVVSGSDGNELNKICKALGLDIYFKTINGSPTPKKQLVKQILHDYQYNISEVALIGDSINDQEASNSNNITFLGYNNPRLNVGQLDYITSFPS